MTKLSHKGSSENKPAKEPDKTRSSKKKKKSSQKREHTNLAALCGEFLSRQECFDGLSVLVQLVHVQVDVLQGLADGSLGSWSWVLLEELLQV